MHPTTNGTDVAIPDLGTASSPITVSGCTGNASAATTVEVHIVHTYRADLVIDLVAPNGTVRNLLNRAGGSADNVDQTFTVDMSAVPVDGTWSLRVRDSASFDTGYHQLLDHRSLTPQATPGSPAAQILQPAASIAGRECGLHHGANVHNTRPVPLQAV